MKRHASAAPSPLPVALQAVADTAGAVLAAEAGQPDAVAGCGAEHQAAVIAAVTAGHSLPDIAACAAGGQDRAREELRGELLKRVARTGRRKREVATEHDDAIRRASVVGLSAREIAAAAEVAPATIRAVLNRPEGAGVGEQPADGDTPADEPIGEQSHAWSPDGARFAGQTE